MKHVPLIILSLTCELGHEPHQKMPIHVFAPNPHSCEDTCIGEEVTEAYTSEVYLLLYKRGLHFLQLAPIEGVALDLFHPIAIQHARKKTGKHSFELQKLSSVYFN